MNKVRNFLVSALVLLLCAALMVISTTTISDLRIDVPITNSTTGYFSEVNVTDDVCIVGGECLSTVTGVADGNNYTTGIGFNKTGSTVQLNLAILGMSNLSATFTDSDSGAAGGDNVVVDVLDFGATGDGSTDDTDAIQAAINNISSTGGVIYLPIGTYNITHPIYFNSSTNNIDWYFIGAGKGTVLKPNFGSSSNGNNFTIYVNQDPDGDRVLSYPSGPRIFFESFRVDGANTDNVSFILTDQVGVVLRDIKTARLYYGLKTVNDVYTDSNQLDKIVASYPREGGWFYYQSGNGDGVTLTRSQMEGNAIYMKGANGAHIDAVIGGCYWFYNTRNIEISNSHFEVDTYYDWHNCTPITSRGSQGLYIKNNYFGSRYGNTMIEIKDDSIYLAGKVFLENNFFVMMAEDSAQLRAIDINFVNMSTSGSEIYMKNNFGIFNPVGATGFEFTGIRVVATDTASLNTLLSTNQHRMSENIQIRYVNGSWAITDRDQPNLDTYQRQADPTFYGVNQQTASYLNGNIDSGTNYFYKVATYDRGYWSNTSAASNRTTTSDNVTIELIVRTKQEPVMVRFWRGNSATNLTEYVDIPSWEYMPYFYDTGDTVAGYAWNDVSVPAITTDNNSTNLLDFDGGMEIGSISVVTNASLCWTSTKKIGYCTGSVNATGVCSSCVTIT